MKAFCAVSIIFGAALVGGCDRIPGTNAALEGEARQGLDATLNDSVSARFKDVKATTSPLDNKSPMLCGLVNAKNRMNAYGGWRRFIVERGGPFAVISPDADDNSPQQMQAMQGAFESVYPDDDRCPSSGYVPTGVVADMLKATQTK